MGPMTLNELKSGGKVKIVIAGEQVEVDGDAEVVATLTTLLEERGIDSFSIIVDGIEVLHTSSLPATFVDAKSIEVRKLVKAGLN